MKFKITNLIPALFISLALSVPMNAEAKKKKHKAIAKSNHSRTIKKKHKAKHAPSAMIELPAKRVPSTTGYASAVEYLRIGYQD
jgi:hypothetical protein